MTTIHYNYKFRISFNSAGGLAISNILFKFDLRKLSIRSNKRTLKIEDVVFSLDQENRAIGIRGDSGIGKTTIFRSLFTNYLHNWKENYDLSVSCNHIFNNQNIDEKDLLKNRIPFQAGFATQVPYFFERNTVQENLYAPLSWMGVTLAETDRLEHAELFHLKDLLQERVENLSGGQRQLLNIARSLILRPQLAIFDECFSNMHESLSQSCISKIRKFFPECFFLVTSHRQSDVDTFGCPQIRLVQESHRSGDRYVTMENKQA